MDSRIIAALKAGIAGFFQGVNVERWNAQPGVLTTS
jgi:hypothetical protein